jgi:nucleoside-diphosphate-sugar epimerase
MKVLVSGATGVAGSSAVPALVSAGHEVTAVARDAAKAERLRARGVVPVDLDLFDAGAARRAVAGHEAVCNLATRIPPLSRAGRLDAWAENDRIRRVASANLVDAALTAGVTRFVQESIGFLYPDHGDEWIDEDLDPAPTPVTASALTAEANLARFTAAGHTGVVLRFAQFYGPSAGHSIAMVDMARTSGLAPMPGDPGERYTSWIHVDDIGTAVAKALDAPAGIYNVGDEEPLRRAELRALFAESLGRPRLRTPDPRRGEPARATSRSHRLSNAAFTEATGWAPSIPAARAGWPAVIRTLAGS